MFWGIVLIIIGAVLLLDKVNIIAIGSFWDYIWPILILAVGIRMIITHNQKITKGDNRDSGSDINVH